MLSTQPCTKTYQIVAKRTIGYEIVRLKVKLLIGKEYVSVRHFGIARSKSRVFSEPKLWDGVSSISAAKQRFGTAIRLRVTSPRSGRCGFHVRCSNRFLISVTEVNRC